MKPNKGELDVLIKIGNDYDKVIIELKNIIKRMNKVEKMINKLWGKKNE